MTELLGNKIVPDEQLYAAENRSETKFRILTAFAMSTATKFATEKIIVAEID